MAFKFTCQLNLRLVDIQNKRWRTCVFVPFKIVLPLPVACCFIVPTGQRRIRISVSSKLLEYFGDDTHRFAIIHSFYVIGASNAKISVLLSVDLSRYILLPETS